MDGRQYSPDSARHGIVRNRTVGYGEMSFLKKLRAANLKFEVFDPSGGPSLERRVNQRFQDVPDLCPALAHRPTEEVRMFRSQYRPVGVVIELDVVRPPPQQEREAVSQKQVDSQAERRRPLVGRADRRLRPVLLVNKLRHFTASAFHGGLLVCSPGPEI